MSGIPCPDGPLTAAQVTASHSAGVDKLCGVFSDLQSADPLTDFLAALAECEAKAEEAREFDNAERLAEIDRYAIARKGRVNPHE